MRNILSLTEERELLLKMRKTLQKEIAGFRKEIRLITEKQDLRREVLEDIEQWLKQIDKT